MVLGAFESESGYGDGRFMVRDAATKALEYLSGESTGSAWTGLWRAVTANVDADPQGEVCITSSSTYSGKIFCYDGLTHAEQWQTTLASGLSFRSLAFADLDGDGGLELIAGVGQEHTGAPGLYVYAYEAATGFLRWRTPDLGLSGFPSLSLVRVAQVDGDSALEVLVAAYGDRLRIFDGASGALQLTTGDLGITALEVATDDLGGNAEVMVGTQDGAILRIHPGTGAVAQTLASYGGRIDGLRAAHVDADAVVDLVLGLGGTLLLHDGATALPVWQSPYLGTGTGADDALIVADLDADGVVEAMIGTVRGVVIYRLGNDPDVIFADGFESGDTTGWSQTVP
ncbi:MAG: hypothetical protein HC897_17075 [Thermoanaerobaculia bacterium]|nr:hypothetical protein [Thermoanaerobaculia bacterium]